MKEKANYPNNKYKNENKIELFLAFRRRAKWICRGKLGLLVTNVIIWNFCTKIVTNMCK